jgi:hypothetical protein
MADGSIRKRFWVEIACGVLGTFLLVLTLISKEWIEEIFHVEPDGGSGALEWAIALGLLTFAVVSFVLARREYLHRGPGVVNLGRG